MEPHPAAAPTEGSAPARDRRTGAPPQDRRPAARAPVPNPFVLVPAVGHRPSGSTPRLAVRGTLLRSILLLVLHQNRPRCVTVQELGQAVEAMGFTVTGRIGKSVSDALRTERTRGRVSRCGRGRYRILALPRTTRWRCRRRVVAALAGDALPQHLAPRRPGSSTDAP